jgi:hypothetical protein
MKSINFILILFLFACKAKNDGTPIPSKPEIDFSQNKFFTMDEILACKTQEDCNQLHYWENKSLSLQGYISYVEPSKRVFTLHTSLDYGSSKSGNISINPMDSVAIAAKLSTALDKKCYVKTVCQSGQIIVSNCQATLMPVVMSVNDIEIK